MFLLRWGHPDAHSLKDFNRLQILSKSRSLAFAFYSIAHNNKHPQNSETSQKRDEGCF